MRAVLATVLLSACALTQLAQPTVVPPPTANPADVQRMQHESAVRSSGHPTMKTKAELDAKADKMLAKFKLVKKTFGHFETMDAITIDGASGMCYAVVLRLGDGATWDAGAEAGMVFDFQLSSGMAGVPGSAGISGKAGPGLIGPGAIGAIPCLDGPGRVTLRLAAIDGNRAQAPIGHGPYSIELWSHRQTPEELRHLVDDQRRQDEEYRRYQAEEAAKAKATCTKCQARYEGCRGAGRTDFACRDEFRQCAFDHGDYRGSCHVE